MLTTLPGRLPRSGTKLRFSGEAVMRVLTARPFGCGFANRHRHFALMLLIPALSVSFAAISQSHASRANQRGALASDVTPAQIVPGDQLKSGYTGADATVDCKELGQVVMTSWTSATRPYLWADCAHITVNGAAPEIRSAGETPYFGHDNKNPAMITPPDTVISGEYYFASWFDDPNTNRHQKSHLAHLYLDGKRLMVKPEDHWTPVSTGCAGKVIVGHRAGSDRFEHGERWVLCADVYKVDRPRPDVGTVMVVHWKTKETCALPVPGGGVGERRYLALPYNWKEETETELHPPCTADTAGGIQLEAVPSATRILLTDDLGCERSDAENSNVKTDFWIELRTTAKSVTVNEIPIQFILSFPKGAIVAPGLQLVDFHLKEGVSAQRNLGCIMVTTSASPPPSA